MIETEFAIRGKDGRPRKYPVRFFSHEGRLIFPELDFALKDEIKAMKGQKFDWDNKVWSVEDCQRNHFQIAYLTGQKPYAWFDRPLVKHQYTRPLMPHQCDLADSGLTYHYQLWAAEMGTGKTLAAQEVIERSGCKHWWWVGPKSSLPNIKRELAKWGFDFDSVTIEFLTYDAMVARMDGWKDDDVLPGGVIFDESSKLKACTTYRSKAAQKLADMIREKFGFNGYVILMSGTPSPKTPVDWWSQCEIAWPGYLREGSPQALESRLAFMVKKEFDQGIVNVRDGWRDDERKCASCGKLYDEAEEHETWHEDYHPWEPSKNEVAGMFGRLKGLVVVKHKKDCLSLPEKRYRVIRCEPIGAMVRAAKSIAMTASNAMTAMTNLRELSDGFQYFERIEGTTRCTHCETGSVFEWFDNSDPDRIYRNIDILEDTYAQTLERREVPCPKCQGTREMPKKVRETKEYHCPKEAVLRGLLEENEEVGRVVIFAGFTGSVDRVVKICHKEKWNVVRLDSRGYQITDCNGNIITAEGLEYWDTHPGKVAFVANPESGGMSLTLVAARMAIFWSNVFKPEYRIQAEDRIHRKGMDENLGCEIVDIIHLSSDDRVLEIIRENRNLELMTMGEFMEIFKFEESQQEDGGEDQG